jgi:RNA polymerase sigma-70 factor (ECF subfamily)
LVRAAIDTARLAWPGVEMPAEEFFLEIARRVDGEHDVEAAVRALQLDDLYLACALARGNTCALEQFDARLMPAISKYVHRIRRSKAFVAEVEAILRSRLLVAETGQLPRISSYRGRGALGAWLRVSAVRVARELLRREGRREHGEQGGLGEAQARDTEIEFAKRHYSKEFKEAFQRTIQNLSTGERALLRLHYLQGMPVRAIARSYHVHHATIARRIDRIRDEILKEVHDTLSRKLELEKRELDHLLGLIESQLEVSLRRWLENDR